MSGGSRVQGRSPARGTGGDTPRQACKAWRIVAEAWLLESGEVVEKTNPVLPHSFGRVGS